MCKEGIDTFIPLGDTEEDPWEPESSKRKLSKLHL